MTSYVSKCLNCSNLTTVPIKGASVWCDNCADLYMSSKKRQMAIKKYLHDIQDLLQRNKI